MSDTQEPTRRSFTETAKDTLSMAAEKAREMAQYATGAVFTAEENVKEMVNSEQSSDAAPVENENVQAKNLSQPWDIGAPSALSGPIESDGLKYGCKPASPQEVSGAALHSLAHPTESLKTF
uniref:Late embryogenesis abundant protein n=1 Tax=Panagrolaimus davidi TaxID=227884 RepID=A0A914QAL2_9BILA